MADQTLDGTLAGAPESQIGLQATQVPGASAAAAQRTTSSKQVGPGMQLGRYVVLELLGSGGMGQVFSAWDPQLDRKLALKLLHARAGGFDTGGRARLLREAQAMAKLEHPNVVTIHDVGTVAGVDGEPMVFIAMEYIEGLSLRAWLASKPREWTEILAVFRAAGEGLCAAHAVGLVHRDFKPDNVMVGKDGRVRVLDFGLARRGDDTIEQLPSSPAQLEAARLGLTSSAGDSLGSLTRTGVLVGTPAYMSPEQFQHAALDARSDQFSFCIALWEALCGERPFAGTQQAALMKAVLTGELRPFRRDDVPTRVVAALRRGLATDPGARWPDMPALLAALEPPASRQRAWLRPGLVLVAGGALALSYAVERQREPSPIAPVDCSAAGQGIAEHWDADVAERIASNLEASKLSWAPRTAARVEAELDAWAMQWSDEAELACTAFHHRHELSSELFDLRMACLDQQRTAFTSLTQLLAESESTAELVEGAVAAATSLAEPGACRSEDLRARTSEDPALAAEISAISLELDRADQIQMLAQFERSTEVLDALDARIEASGRHELRARQLMLRSINEQHLGQIEAAVDTAIEAVAAGGRSGLDDATLNALIALIRMTLRSGLLDESERWLMFGEGLCEQVQNCGLSRPRTPSEPGPSREGYWLRYELDKAHGFLALDRGRPDLAAEHFARALALATEQLGPESIERAWELTTYGHALVLANPPTSPESSPERRAAGYASWRQGVALSEKILGPEHPFTVGPRFALADQLISDGELELARAELAGIEATLSPDLGPEDRNRKRLAKLRAKLDEAAGADG